MRLQKDVEMDKEVLVLVLVSIVLVLALVLVLAPLFWCPPSPLPHRIASHFCMSL